MEINEHDLLHQTNLVQYEKLLEHDEDKLIQINHYSYHPKEYLVYYDEDMLSKQELLNFVIKHDEHEQLLKIHNHKLFEHDQMYTKIIFDNKINFRK